MIRPPSRANIKQTVRKLPGMSSAAQISRPIAAQSKEKTRKSGLCATVRSHASNFRTVCKIFAPRAAPFEINSLRGAEYKGGILTVILKLFDRIVGADGGSPLWLGFASLFASTAPRRLVSRRWRSRSLDTLPRDGREVAGTFPARPRKFPAHSLLGRKKFRARNAPGICPQPMESLALSAGFFADSAEIREIPCLFPACREFLLGEDASLERRAEPLHRRAEFREAGRDHAHVVDRHRLAAREPHDEEAHRDAVVQVRGDEPAAARRPASDDKIVALEFDARRPPPQGPPRRRRAGRSPRPGVH